MALAVQNCADNHAAEMPPALDYYPYTHTGKSVGPSFFYLALTVLWTLLRRRRPLTGPRLSGLAVFAGGSLANLAEALLTGGVTDFVPLHLGPLTMLFSAGDLAVLAGTVAGCLAFLQRRVR